MESGRVGKSAHLGNRLGLGPVHDLDRDGRPEILVLTNSADNDRWFNDQYRAYADSISWLMVLTQDLKPAFPPKAFPLRFSSVHPFVLASRLPGLHAAYKSRNQEEGVSALYRFDTQGSVLDSVVLRNGNFNFFINTFREKIHIYYQDGSLETYDHRLRKEVSISIPENALLFPVNEKGTRRDQWLLLDRIHNELSVYDYKFRDPVSVRIPSGIPTESTAGFYMANGEQQIWLQKGDEVVLMRLLPNPLFAWKPAIFLLVYAGMLLIVLLAMRLQRLGDQRKRQLEEQIADLQLKTIKNQVDPHFVFNAVNIISEMNLGDDKIGADNYICELSDLMRRTLQSSDRLQCSLGEEIEYVENYIRLQRIRLQNSFDYSQDIDPGIDLSRKVPKHILYTHVENAIKHGLHGLNRKGRLHIAVGAQGEALLMQVEDNGHGAKKSFAAPRPSTGNGLKIMEQMIELYQLRYGQRIEFSMEHVRPESGTWVRIWIRN